VAEVGQFIEGKRIVRLHRHGLVQQVAGFVILIAAHGDHAEDDIGADKAAVEAQALAAGFFAVIEVAGSKQDIGNFVIDLRIVGIGPAQALEAFEGSIILAEHGEALALAAHRIIAQGIELEGFLEINQSVLVIADLEQDKGPGQVAIGIVRIHGHCQLGISHGLFIVTQEEMGI